jgi:vacuolar protein sorting-associated protein 54
MDLSNDLVDTFLSWDDQQREDAIQINPISSTFNCTVSKVKNTILALRKCGKLSTMTEIYKEKLSETIRVTVITTVNECAVDAAKGDVLTSTTSATMVSMPVKGTKEHTSFEDTTKSSTIEGVTSMTFDQFMECLNMIFENILSLLKSAAGVSKFCLEEGISFKDEDYTNDEYNEDLSGRGSMSNTPSALAKGADLSHRSISELLRLRKDTHSLIAFDEMRRLWDSCLTFTVQVERISGQKAYVLRSTLLAQAKAFVERKHEANMSNLAAALDAERWIQCDVSFDTFMVIDIFVSIAHTLLM